MIVDLHTHSHYSDGHLSPAELVQFAKARGVELLALTDHDTVDGLAQAKSAAKLHDITFVPGIEFSATWQNTTLHILGLYIDADNTQLNSAILQNQRHRQQRNDSILKQLQKIGANMDALIAKNDDSLITRSHIAHALLEQGYGKTNKDIFKHYLRRGRPGFTQANWLAANEICQIIVQTGGIAVLAHPLRYQMTASKLKRLLSELTQGGLNGIEVLSGPGNAKQFEFLRDIAKQFNLKVSAGSDFHHPEQLHALPGKHFYDTTLNAVWH